MSDINQILDRLGLILPEAKAPLGAYVPYAQTGNLLMVSGQGPIGASGAVVTGRLGDGLEIEDGIREYFYDVDGAEIKHIKTLTE